MFLVTFALTVVLTTGCFNCPTNCTCSENASTPRKSTLDCARRGIGKVPILDPACGITEAYLQGNNLTDGPKPGMGYDNITILDLSYNKIKEIDWLPSQMMNLYAHHNNINHIKPSVYEHFGEINETTVYNNSFPCGCSIRKLYSYLSMSNSTTNGNITCQSSDGVFYNATEVMRKECIYEILEDMILPVTILLSFWLVIVILYLLNTP